MTGRQFFEPDEDEKETGRKAGLAILASDPTGGQGAGSTGRQAQIRKLPERIQKTG